MHVLERSDNSPNPAVSRWPLWASCLTSAGGPKQYHPNILRRRTYTVLGDTRPTASNATDDIR
jgi:hypothetical protein